MATILEGLNAISQAVGGTGEAESNLEALNQISEALGGSADATENADAIANIAENASGGGGSNTANVTFIGKEGLAFFGAMCGLSLETNDNTFVADNPTRFSAGVQTQIPLLNSFLLYDIVCYSDESTVLSDVEFSVSGNAEITADGIVVTGDCTIMVSHDQ